MQVRVNAQSQAHRLRERLEEAAVSHGAALRADLRNVRVTALAGGSDGLAFFCHVEPIGVRELLSRGDGRPLPHGIEVAGMHVPDVGLYDILNAHISSNGELRVVLDEASRVVAAARPEPAPREPAPGAERPASPLVATMV